jgi:hypothetical protein
VGEIPVNAHNESHSDSAFLCDSLFQGLSQRIRDLQREERQRWCCFFKPGCRRFAYVSHRKQSARLEVWFLGEVESPDQYPTLDIRKRSPTSGGFGQAFKARFYLDNLSQMPDAINLLYYVSYFLSYVQGTELTGRTTPSSADKDDSASFNNTAVVEKVFIEGEKRAAVTMTRNSRLRTAAKRKWGLRCYCCGFDFEYFYGSIAKDFAIVHHLEPFSDAAGNLRESTVDDVRVLCANCHYVIHLETPPMDVDVLKERISQVWSPWSDHGVWRK